MALSCCQEKYLHHLEEEHEIIMETFIVQIVFTHRVQKIILKKINNKNK